MRISPAQGKVLAHHPLPEGFLPSVGPRRAMSFLYPSEDAALMACTGVPLQRRVLYGVLAREGMRFGEAASLQWSDVDVATGVVVLDRTKTSEPRSWKLGDDVVSTLTTYKKTHPSKDDDAGHIFVDEAGGAFVGKKLSQTFRNDLKLAGIKRPQLFERSGERIAIRLHDLRSSFTTLALANGRTETWVVDRAGWKSSAMIARYRRQARTATELNLGWFHKLNESIAELAGVKNPPPKSPPPSPRPAPKREQEPRSCSGICSAPGTGEANTKGASANFSVILAEREGFEPSVPLRAHMISNHAPSATRSSLHRLARLISTAC